METPPAILTEDLTKRYGERVGVDGIAIAVPEGSVFGFIGPNGAGKSTAIRLLLGFLRPDNGRARIFGRDCWSESHLVKRDLGYVPGDLRIHEWMTGADALLISGRARGTDLGPAGRRLAGEFDLDLTVRVREMSRGMRQKLGLILALAHEPKLLVLDEPTTALDPLTQDRLYRRLRALAAEQHTIFFSSHVLSEVEDLCDRVAIVRNGRLVADETLDALRARAKRAVTIRWKAGAAEDPTALPPSLELFESQGAFWRCGLGGEIPELLAWLRDRPVADLSIGPPDLDTLFRGYYEDGP